MIIRRSDLEDPEIDFYELSERPTYGQIKNLNPTQIVVREAEEILEYLMESMGNAHLLTPPILGSSFQQRKLGRELTLYRLESQAVSLGYEVDENLFRRISDLEERVGRKLCRRGEGRERLLITPQVLFREAYSRAREHISYVGITWAGIGIDRRRREIRGLGCINGLEVYCLYHPELQKDSIKEMLKEKVGKRGIIITHAKMRRNTVNVQIDSIQRDRVHEFDITHLPVVERRQRQYADWFNIFTTCDSRDGLFYTHFRPQIYTPIYFCMHDVAGYIETLIQRRTGEYGPRIALYPFLAPTREGMRLADNMRSHVVVLGEERERKLTKTEQEVLLHLATIRFGYDRIWRDTSSRTTENPLSYSLTIQE